MELVWIIYLIEVICQPMFGLGFILTITCFACLYGYLVVKFCGNEIPEQAAKIPFGKVSIFCATVLLLSNLIPSKETAYLMLGAYGVQTVTETVASNPEIQKIGKRTLSLVENAIAKYEQELKPATTENK